MNKNVVFVCDEGYVKYTYVAAFSLISNAKNREGYIIHIITDDSISLESVQLMNSLEKQFNGVVVNIHKVKEDYDEIKIPENTNFTKATFYRLNIDKYLSDVSICLYLDSDVIINDSIDDIFLYDVSDYYVRGVKQIGNRLNKATEVFFRDKYGLPSVDQYINAGVMLLNLDKIRKDGIAKQFMNNVDKSFEVDQFIINLVCYGKIGFLPYRYNVAGRMSRRFDILSRIFEKKEIEDAYKKAAIVHFTDKKPWQYLNLPYSDIWWLYASKTSLYDKFVSDFFKFYFNPRFIKFSIADNMDELLSYLRGKRIIIYGAGNLAIRFYRVLLARGMRPYCFVTSKKVDIAMIDGFEVKQINEVDAYSEESVFTIAMGEKYWEEVICNLNDNTQYYCLNEEWISSYECQLRERKKDLIVKQCSREMSDT